MWLTALKPPPPGMFWVTTVGRPGRCLPIWWATVRPQRSTAPPDAKPVMMDTVLPARFGCAPAGAALAISAARTRAAVRRAHAMAAAAPVGERLAPARPPGQGA